MPRTARVPAPLRTLLCALALVALAPRVARAEGFDLTGRRAPELYVPQGYQGVASGTTLSTYAGRVLVLKFFFTTCPACRASMPEFQRLYDAYAGRDDVRFLALAVDDWGSVASLASSGGYRFPIGLDPSGVTASRFGVESYPTHYVIGGDGVVIAYDTVATWAIDRGVAALTATRDAARDRNVRELGDVPTALADAKAAAAENDYGRVLRIVEAHLDAAKDPADVVAAAQRIQQVAWGRYENRKRRIAGVFAADRTSGWRLVEAFERDFAGTSKGPDLRAWAATLGPRPPVAGR